MVYTSWRVPVRQAVGAAGTEEGDTGDAEGQPDDEDGFTSCDTRSAALGQAEVGDDSGADIGKGSLRPVRCR